MVWINEGRDIELQLLNEPQQRTPEDKLKLNQYDKINEFEYEMVRLKAPFRNKCKPKREDVYFRDLSSFASLTEKQKDRVDK